MGVILPAELVKHGPNWAEIQVFHAFTRLSRKFGNTLIWMNLQSLAAECGVSEAALRHAVKNLTRWGVLATWKELVDEGGRLERRTVHDCLWMEYYPAPNGKWGCREILQRIIQQPHKRTAAIPEGEPRRKPRVTLSILGAEVPLDFGDPEVAPPKPTWPQNPPENFATKEAEGNSLLTGEQPVTLREADGEGTKRQESPDGPSRAQAEPAPPAPAELPAVAVPTADQVADLLAQLGNKARTPHADIRRRMAYYQLLGTPHLPAEFEGRYPAPAPSVPAAPPPPTKPRPPSERSVEDLLRGLPNVPKPELPDLIRGLARRIADRLDDWDSVAGFVPRLQKLADGKYPPKVAAKAWKDALNCKPGDPPPGAIFHAVFNRWEASHGA